MGANFEVAANLGQQSEIQRALLELGHAAAVLADEVMVVVLGQLVAWAIAEIEPAHQPQLREEVQRPVNSYQPDPGAARSDALQALVLLGLDRLQNRHPLRRHFEPAPPYLPYYPLKLQRAPILIEKDFQLQEAPYQGWEDVSRRG